MCEQIGGALRTKDAYHVVVVRSTVLPGTTQGIVIPALERTSGKKYGTGFGVAVNPEFLREGTAIHDFRNPPMTLVGHNYASDAEPAMALYAQGRGRDGDDQRAHRRDDQVRQQHLARAEGDCFANEVGQSLQAAGDRQPRGDGHLLPATSKLNLSSYYMKPGFAFGGSCLPKDVRAMQYRAKEVDLDMPVIQSILGSNQLQIQHAIDLVVDTGKKRVGLLGFSFKAGTDDLRESPIVILAEALLGKGCQSQHLRPQRLAGAAGRARTATTSTARSRTCRRS